MIGFATVREGKLKEKTQTDAHLANKENLWKTTGLALKIDKIGMEVVLRKPETPVF